MYAIWENLNFLNSPIGLLYNHKKQIIFQKASCHYCILPIGYLNVENKIKRDFDSKYKNNNNINRYFFD